MATGKRFYWIKLKESFMTSDSVDYLMSQPNGASYVVLYQMLCLKTINTDGKLARQIGEVIIPYDIPKIQRDCKYFSEDTIRVALQLYQNLGLVYLDTDGTLVMTDHANLVGSETDWASQKKLQRKNSPPALPVDTTVDTTVEIVHTDIRDKRLDIRDKENRDIEIDINTLFERFWSEYPKKVAKGAAQKAFTKAMKLTTVDVLISAVDKAKMSKEWQKDNGQFIPYPATWLNQHRWEDEDSTPQKSDRRRVTLTDFDE